MISNTGSDVATVGFKISYVRENVINNSCRMICNFCRLKDGKNE